MGNRLIHTMQAKPKLDIDLKSIILSIKAPKRPRHQCQTNPNQCDSKLYIHSKMNFKAKYNTDEITSTDFFSEALSWLVYFQPFGKRLGFKIVYYNSVPKDNINDTA